MGRFPQVEIIELKESLGLKSISLEHERTLRRSCEKALEDRNSAVATLRAENERLKGFLFKQIINMAFYRSCALSGEIPTEGSEPHPRINNKESEDG